MKKTNGFSLMETMIVLLIVSVIAAASAPMINKKMITAASDKSPWVWVGGKNIAYNLKNADFTASIGTTNKGDAGARLHILTNNNTPQISLQYGDNKPLWRLFANNNSLNLSTSENTPDSSVAIGSSVTPANNSVVVGYGAQGIAGCVAIGANTSADGNSITIGSGAKINGSQSIALGSSYDDFTKITDIFGDNSIAIGFNSKVIAVDGHGTESSVSNSTAIGASSQVSASNATALGAESQAQGSNSIAIGYNAKAPTITWKGQTIDRKSATAIGALASASGNYGIALGGGDSTTNTQTEAKGDSSIAIGRGAESIEASTIAIGRASKANGSRAIAIGSKTDDDTADTQTKAEGISSIAIGSRASANDYSIAIGSGSGGTANTQTKAEGISSIAIGRGAESTAASAIAIGRASVSEGSGAIAIGSKTDDDTTTKTSATAENSIAIGRDASASHNNSVAIGYKAQTFAQNQIVLGKRRTPNSVVDDSTNVYIPGNLYVGGTTYLGTGNNAATYMRFGDNYKMHKILVNSSDDLYIDNNNFVTFGESYGYKENYAGGTTRPVNRPSDRRLKDVGKAFKGGLEEIKKLEVFNYTFKKDKSKTPRVGVMAQDLEKIFPNAVFKGEDGFLRIRMEDMFYAMVNAIKELDSKISILEQKQKKIDELESKVTKLEKRLADLEKKIK